MVCRYTEKYVVMAALKELDAVTEMCLSIVGARKSSQSGGGAPLARFQAFTG